ncbi:Poly-beta-1,6-N-acetyl-D-glucosamine synthase [BD1-7 clade bacterium]|nr:Poly-beta-1,6-N-acetyl-D-glucosamine synthase [BD1-7 clade bacterium]
MIDGNTVVFLTHSITHVLANSVEAIIVFMPMVLLIELPLSLLVFSGMLRWHYRYYRRGPLRIQPTVSCLITCYSEGEDVRQTIVTLCEQTYRGHIEIIPIIDGATQNADTYNAAIKCREFMKRYPGRTLRVLPKWQRGGRVSSLNAGLSKAHGEIVLALDGDTSFDNDMISKVVHEFQDPNVPAVAGSLRVRNLNSSLATCMQGLEYMISLQGAKVGLAEWNMINNISGAFGAFRRKFLLQIGGWNTHSAEDLDLTIRIKQYMGRHKNLRIPFAAHGMGHTDAPDTFRQLLQQRLRWDGDLLFLFMRKHKYAFSKQLMGRRNTLFTLVYGLMQSIMLPFLMIIYNIWVLVTYPTAVFVAVLLVQYTYYLVMATLHFLFFWLLVSERFRDDARMLIWLPVFPLYSLGMRLFSAFAILNEWIRRSHEESNMAPWWVLKKGKRF